MSQKNSFRFGITVVISALTFTVSAQKNEPVTLIKSGTENKVDVSIGGKPFTSFLYPDSLEKPVLFPLRASNGTVITRGFPLAPNPGEPTDHPHHIGLWFNFENVNGLDFWNNSYAIPANKKSLYGWIRTDKILETSGGKTGKLAYHANWTNQEKDVILEETTRFEFSGNKTQRVIDRVTTLKANVDVVFNDAKDGMLGLRLAHELQMPTTEDQKFTDNKGNVTVVKGGTDHVANGNYLTSAGKTGNDAWSTRGVWCKVYGKMGVDSVSIAIIDHPKNPNYPTFWHARGYGLFAANPLGEKVFTNGKSEKNLRLKKGESVTFRYRIVISSGAKTMPVDELNSFADEFAMYDSSKATVSMKTTLQEISNLAIRLNKSVFTAEQKKSNWLGNTASSDEEIKIAEKRLGILLPDDYKKFLLITNGFATPNDSTEPSFEKIGKIDYLKNVDPTLLEVWNKGTLTDVGAQLNRSIVIAGINEEQYFLLIPPTPLLDKWQYWKFANWIPGEHRYESLGNYFDSVLDFMKRK